MVVLLLLFCVSNRDVSRSDFLGVKFGVSCFFLVADAKANKLVNSPVSEDNSLENSPCVLLND